MSTTDRHPTRRMSSPSLLALLLLTALVLGACASAGSALNPGPPSRDSGGTGVAPGEAGYLPVSGGVTDAKGDFSSADLAARRIVKTGEITIEVSNVGTAIGKVRALALQLGGYVGSSQLGSPIPYPDPLPYPQQPDGTSEKAPVYTGSATLTLRIPAARFDEAITRLHAFDGTVVTEITQEQDVTSQLVDIAARLKNLQASETQYRALLEKAVTIEDILAVQIRLDDVRGQIEQWQAQQKQLGDVADLATLTVTLSSTAIQQATNTWDPGKTVSDAVAALVTVGQNVANGIIWFVIVWLPALIVIGILAMVAWRFVPRMRRPAMAIATAAGAPKAEAPEQKS